MRRLCCLSAVSLFRLSTLLVAELCALSWQRRARAGAASGRASCWWSRLRRDSLTVLSRKWRRRTHCAGFACSVQTAPSSQSTMHAARAHFLAPRLQHQQGAPPDADPALFRPAGGMPRFIRAAMVVSKHATIWICHGWDLSMPPLRVAACHERGDKSRCGAWLGALLASEVCGPTQVCPLSQTRGWRACLSARRARVAQPPELDRAP